jgi:hypothetical protein
MGSPDGNGQAISAGPYSAARTVQMSLLVI